MQVGTQMHLMENIFTDEGKTASRSELRALIETQGFRCALTGVLLEPADAEIDHIMPVSLGGTHTIGNMQVLHRVVNRMKGALGNDEFIAWCRAVANHTAHPPVDAGSPDVQRN